MRLKLALQRTIFCCNVATTSLSLETAEESPNARDTTYKDLTVALTKSIFSMNTASENFFFFLKTEKYVFVKCIHVVSFAAERFEEILKVRLEWNQFNSHFIIDVSQSSEEGRRCIYLSD